MDYEQHGMMIWDNPVDTDTLIQDVTDTVREDADYGAYTKHLDPVAVRHADRGEDLYIPYSDRKLYREVRVYRYRNEFQNPDIAFYTEADGDTTALAFSYEEWRTTFRDMFNAIQESLDITDSVVQSTTLGDISTLNEPEYGQELFHTPAE